ncbi:Sec-independent protein translocase subunit TatA [Nocardia sp. NPDC004568]|uniref:Sec-independent protein translocase subunit TatA n=1 Tax=Nocardia sp. NPDC004568 TaxID=3154551 RepID=UPI0033B902BB
MGSLSIWHWLIIAALFVVFFGAKRMPDAARSLGRSLRIFKSEVSEMHNDGKPASTATAQPAPELPAGRETAPPATETRSESKTL